MFAFIQNWRLGRAVPVNTRGTVTREQSVRTTASAVSQLFRCCLALFCLSTPSLLFRYYLALLFINAVLVVSILSSTLLCLSTPPLLFQYFLALLCLSTPSLVQHGWQEWRHRIYISPWQPVLLFQGWTSTKTAALRRRTSAGLVQSVTSWKSAVSIVAV